MARIKFNNISESEKEAIFRQTGELKNLPAFAIEKDWWVVQTLSLIFETSIKDYLVFKGGTSLSKAWKLIDRFSEDIDLAADRSFFGFEGNLSRSKITKLRKASNEYISKSLFPEIKLKFEEKGWTVKVTNKIEANSMNGDVDIIIEDKNTTLYIQLKRTYFRLTPKDAYYESINTDRRAAQQLNDAEVYLSKKNDILIPKHKPVKWIVTTSYENILADIDGCKKVNYFDILSALNRPFGKSVKDLIDFIQKDKLIQNLIDIYNSGEQAYAKYVASVAHAGLPLQLVRPQTYRQSMFAANDSFLTYTEIFNKANELNINGFGLKDKNKIIKAIKLFKKCLDINPEDIDVYGALGNCYANIKDYKNSFEAFEKALEIVPNEPYISHNYAIALQEVGKHFESLDILLDLYAMYPFVGDFGILYNNNYLASFQHGLLTSEELLKLSEKYLNLIN
ncbi:MAG: nucleotidyl transferase AbiEii/AbiGii toxin family protein [Bacteroidales bacterium]|nr:nucleotidyl transferase AbiEii/AbiGii toxin family protein [Bacteroidales bacterium]